MPADDARHLRDALVDDLVAAGTVRSAAVEAALRTVPRERFVPDLPLAGVYDDRPQLVKEAGGVTLSTISQPTMIAIMLEAAEVRPGQRVLEIGTGSGYNAALLAQLVGPSGLVVTIDIEADLVRRAGDTLRQLGLARVRAVVADGRDGWPGGAPYDCLMATVGVDAVPAAWREQLADGGRVLAPLQTERRLIVEQRRGDRFETVATSPAAFIPLR